MSVWFFKKSRYILYIYIYIKEPNTDIFKNKEMGKWENITVKCQQKTGSVALLLQPD